METKICKECGRELPIENFNLSRWGHRVDVCTECSIQKRRKNKQKQVFDRQQAMLQAVDQAKRMRLEDFTPRELCEELKRRGFDGKITAVQTVTIDISKM